MSYVLLEDGARFDGEPCGAATAALGEVVFNTAMSGYQESMSDPSYAHQLLVFTYPHIGNYGVSERAMESAGIHACGAIMRAARNGADAAAAEGGWLDWLRSRRARNHRCRHARARSSHPRSGRDARGHLPDRRVGARGGGADWRRAADGRPRPGPRSQPAGGVHARADRRPAGRWPTVAVIDTGIKGSIVAELRARGVRLAIHPCTVTAAELLASGPDGVFIANGPGDPAALDYIVDELRGLVGRVPLFGICLGHQLLCRAVGLETYKLRFGHRGANHPVKDLDTGHIEITSQNHGFAVLGPGGERTISGDEPVRWETDFGVAELTHLNLYDRTVEGLGCRGASNHGPVPPGGRTRATRRAPSVRPLRRRVAARRGLRCRGVTTSSGS